MSISSNPLSSIVPHDAAGAANAPGGSNLKAALDPLKLAQLTQSLYSAAVSDALDGLGYRHQVMNARLRPLLPNVTAREFVGRARTARWMETDYVVEDDPYGLEIDLMDTLEPGDVLVHSTDLSGDITPWGELMTTIAMRRGAVGCVCDSNIRDCAKIIEMGFPVYHAGIRALDSKGRGRVQAYDVPIRCGDVLVHHADVIFADFDGVVVVPGSIAEQVFEAARNKVEKERIVRQELAGGTSLREAYERYRVL